MKKVFMPMDVDLIRFMNLDVLTASNGNEYSAGPIDSGEGDI